MSKNFDDDLEEKSNESNPPDFFGSIYTLERRMRGSSSLILSTAFPSDSSTPITPPTNFPQKCSCRYLWRKELHGLSQLMMSHSLEMRVFWLVVVVICFAGAIWNAQYILSSYVSHDTQTRMRIKQVKSLSFPNLIFCPNSPDAVHVEDIVKDMETRLGGHLNDTYNDLLKYFIAGSGFDYVYIDQFSDEYKRNLQMNYEIWRGNRSTLDLFKFVFEENSITCNEFFQQCTQGSLNANCCEIFSPTFVMLRGRCFKLNGYNQNDADELAKLRLFIKNIPSPLVNNNHFQSNVIMFIGDENIETSTFPRYYLNPNTWNKFRLNSRLIISLPDNPRCSILPRNRGLYTCYVYEYIKESVVGKYNCTLPYYKETLDYVYSVPVCNVSTVIANYSDIKWARLERFKCLPSCSRREISIDWTSAPDDQVGEKSYSYRLELAFNELQEEEYEEIHTTTLPHFISELGGQTGLFLGTSLLTFVQLLVAISLFCYGKIDKFIAQRFAIR